MSNAVLAHRVPETPPMVPGKAIVTGVLAVWLAVVAVLGSDAAFVTSPGKPPVPIAAGVAVPLVLFFAGIGLSQRFRAFLLAVDLSFATAIQAWRFAGFAFIALYTHGILPGAFAWPAGMGDMAIGVTAPWILVALKRNPDFAASRLFVAWNVFGVLDLVVAIGSGALDSALATGVPGEITTAAMAQLPLVLIPAYIVPILLMLHTAALLQARRLTRNPVGSASREACA